MASLFKELTGKLKRNDFKYIDLGSMPLDLPGEGTHRQRVTREVITVTNEQVPLLKYEDPNGTTYYDEEALDMTGWVYREVDGKLLDEESSRSMREWMCGDYNVQYGNVENLWIYFEWEGYRFRTPFPDNNKVECRRRIQTLLKQLKKTMLLSSETDLKNIEDCLRKIKIELA